MKKMILLAGLMLVASITAGAQTTTVSDKTNLNGTNYVSISQRSTGSSDIKTGYTWSNAKDDIQHDIYLHKYSRGDKAGQWTVYVWRTSKKTGKDYKYYLPDGELIAQDIIKRNPELVK